MTAVGFPVTEGLLEPFGYGQGYPDWIFPANPGANTNLAVVVDSRNWWRMISVQATITTDATVQNRWISVDFITAQGKTYLQNGGGFVEAATNGGRVYSWNEQRTDSAAVAGGNAVLPLSSIFLAPGTTVQITIGNKAAGDTITAAVLTVERWDTGPTGYPIGFTAPSPADFV